MDSSDKIRYQTEDVLSLSRTDYNTLIRFASDKYSAMGEMIDFCIENGLDSYAQLLLYAKNNREDWFHVLCDSGTIIGGLFDNLMGIFGGLIDFVTGVFSGNWSQAWNGIVSIFKGIFNMIPLAVETVVNSVTTAVNALVSGINTVTGAVCALHPKHTACYAAKAGKRNTELERRSCAGVGAWR